MPFYIFLQILLLKVGNLRDRRDFLTGVLFWGGISRCPHICELWIVGDLCMYWSLTAWMFILGSVFVAVPWRWSHLHIYGPQQHQMGVVLTFKIILTSISILGTNGFSLQINLGVNYNISWLHVLIFDVSLQKAFCDLFNCCRGVKKYLWKICWEIAVGRCYVAFMVKFIILL